MSDDGLSIGQVLNKQAGSVEFVGIQVDELSGFSVGRTAKIHTNIVQAEEIEILNIIYVNFTDTNVNNSYEAICLEEDQGLGDFKVFGNDSSGSPLQFRILVKDRSIYRVLHNNGGSVEEIQFEEIRWKVGEQAKVTNHRVGS